MNDLIIKGAKGIPDGLYVKKDGELFKYKPNHGTVYTVRSYHIMGRPIGKWVEVDSFESEKHSVTDMRCSLCGKYASIVLPHGNRSVYDFCPNCGAKMEYYKNE